MGVDRDEWGCALCGRCVRGRGGGEVGGCAFLALASEGWKLISGCSSRREYGARTSDGPAVRTTRRARSRNQRRGSLLVSGRAFRRLGFVTPFRFFSELTSFARRSNRRQDPHLGRRASSRRSRTDCSTGARSWVHFATRQKYRRAFERAESRRGVQPADSDARLSRDGSCESLFGGCEGKEKRELMKDAGVLAP